VVGFRARTGRSLITNVRILIEIYIYVQSRVYFTRFSSRLSTLRVMVRSTIIVRANDALPLAASVDDETVRCALLMKMLFLNVYTCHSHVIDGERPSGAQTAGKIDIPTHYAQCRTSLLNREWPIYSTVRPSKVSSGLF